MSVKNKIATIVVTFKKPLLLRNCLNGIINQTELPDSIFIIDNANDQETLKLCKDQFNLNYINDNNYGSLHKGQIKSIQIFYIGKKTNDGGAGGFFCGIDLAIEQNFNYLWLMDDDGIPDKNSLSHLKSAYKSKSVINPLVVDINNRSKLAFWFNKKNKQKDINEFTINKIHENDICAFNGTFLESEIITKFGNVNRDLFIWGDEIEFQLRMKYNKVELFTCTNSIHYHPVNKKSIIIQFPFNLSIRKIDNPFFEFLYYRNRIYYNLVYSIKLNRIPHLLLTLTDAWLNVFWHLLNLNLKKSINLIYSISMGISRNLKIPSQRF